MEPLPKDPLVLVVDAPSGGDDGVSRELEEAGFAVVHTREAAAAAVAIARHSAPAVVLLDAPLSTLDAARVARALRTESATAGIPIVRASVFPATPAVIDESVGAGADVHLARPFGIGEIGILRTLGRLRQAERAAASRAETLRVNHEKKDQFLATLGHELRNPLSAVRVGLSLLKHPQLDPALAARAYATTERQIEALVRLVDDLLDLARITHNKLSIHMATVDLRDVVAGSVESARLQFERSGVALSVDTGSSSVVLQGDANRLAQVVANLLDNARKFTPSGGRVGVALSVDEDVAPRRACLTIRDNGVGIDRKHLAKLFQLFFQDDARAHTLGGLGIGLAIVRHLVELHGGSVHVASDGPGTGAEFVVELPLSPSF